MDTAAPRPRLSVVIPVYGSAPILPELVRQIDDALRVLGIAGQYEIVLVNDCGPGDSWSVIGALGRERPHVKGIALRKNAGQHNAIMAGLSYARGDVIVMMDDDLQHSPYDIPALYRKVLEGYDVCYTDFRSRHHARWKVLGSAVNDRVARFLLKKPKGLYLSPFKAIRRAIRDEIVKSRGPNVYLDGLILTVTSNIATVEVDHHPRHEGRSGYSFTQSFSLWLKMATNFSIAPLRLASFLGLAFSLVGFVLAVWLVVERFANNSIPQGWTSLMVIVLITGGLQLLALGAIGEYLGRVFLTVNNRPQFVVASTLNIEEGLVGAAPADPRARESAALEEARL
jgi:polyisoprenyl-phosphate glycosyltransferase